MAVWAEDEHRPTPWHNRRDQWLYVYALICPTTGQSWWCLLPTVSTDAMQPVERVWTLVDEPVANRVFRDLDALENMLVRRCHTLRVDRLTITVHTRFHWWPPEPCPE